MNNEQQGLNGRAGTPADRIIFHLLSAAAVRPGPCTRLYDDGGYPLAPGSEASRACFEGRRYWDATDPRRARWAYSITPIQAGIPMQARAQIGWLLPDDSLGDAVNGLLAVEDYAKWHTDFATGALASAADIWGRGNEEDRAYTRRSALRHCILGLSRERQLAALALAGIDCLPEALMDRPGAPATAGRSPGGAARVARAGADGDRPA
jgi:hypothetical protein